jgi:CRP/FNR family transcriptional regulator, cyclic AMP receptor protein
MRTLVRRIDDGAEGCRVEDVLARAGIFHGVSRKAAAALTNHLGQLSFPPKRTILREGQPGEYLYIIQAGKVKVRRTTTDGRETLLAVLGPADIFGELALFDPGPRASTVTTLTPVHTMTLDRQGLHNWILEYPQIAEHLLRLLARRVRRTNDALCDLSFADVPGRLARQLLDLATRFGERNGDSMHVDHELTHKELAQLVGSTRETVNKTLQDFTQRGWIRYHGKTIYIDEPTELAQRSSR